MESSQRNMKDFEPINPSQKFQYKLATNENATNAKSSDYKGKQTTLNKITNLRPSKSDMLVVKKNKLEFAEINDNQELPSDKVKSNEIAYQNEILNNKIPRRVKNMPDISADSKKLLEYFKLKLRKYDLSLCLLAVIVIICAVLDVSYILFYYYSKNKLQRITLLFMKSTFLRSLTKYAE